eukprot:3376862-Pyramimonas_sp.AAC.1
MLGCLTQLGSMEVNASPAATGRPATVVPYVPQLIRWHVAELKEKHSLVHVLHDGEKVLQMPLVRLRAALAAKQGDESPTFRKVAD